jgi:hypothetical protein
MPHSPIEAIEHSYFDLFTFGRPGALNDGFKERGIILPWWTDREYLVSFFRPLSALMHDLDGLLWPRSPIMAHVQSLAWYLALLAIVRRVYERLIEPPWVAGLALLLYAIDDTHGDTLNWIANRHSIITAAFGLLALLAHDHARRDEGPAWRAGIGPGCFAVGLLAGEGAILTLAYLASYAAFFDSGPRRSRAWSLWPYGAIVALWRVGYQWQGHGAFASDGYLDASREPAPFFARLPAAVAVLLQGQFSFTTADAWMWSPDRESARIFACAIALVGLLAVVVVPLIRTDPRARFWCASLLAALVPMSGGIPGDRLLLFSGVAAMALLAKVFAAFLQRLALPPGGAGRRTGRATRVAVAIIVGGLFTRKLLLAPLELPFRASGVPWSYSMNRLTEQEVPDAAGLERRTIIVANPPLMDFASCLLLLRATQGEVLPRRVRWLTAGPSSVTLTRTSDRSLVVRPERGFFAERGDRIFRAARRPMRLGEAVVLSDVTVTISELLPNGKPAAAEFFFREPLESPNYLWRSWNDHGCESLHLPGVGKSVTLPAVDTDKLLWSK